MTSPSVEQINAALATVNDPEIRRPITDLGMVDEIRDRRRRRRSTVRILLTVSGCPMRDTLTNDVTAAVAQRPRRHRRRTSSSA